MGRNSSDAGSFDETKLKESEKEQDEKVLGGQIGIAVVADIANTVGVLHEDEIHGTPVAPVREFSCCGFKATAIVKKD